MEPDNLIHRINEISNYSFHNFTDVMDEYRSNVDKFKDLIATISLEYSHIEKNN